LVGVESDSWQEDLRNLKAINHMKRKEMRYLNRSNHGGGQRSCTCIICWEETFIKDNMSGHINSFRDKVKTFVTSMIRAVARKNALFIMKAEFMSKVWSEQMIASTSKHT
jgi:molybdate-binding protein